MVFQAFVTFGAVVGEEASYGAAEAAPFQGLQSLKSSE